MGKDFSFREQYPFSGPGSTSPLKLISHVNKVTVDIINIIEIDGDKRTLPSI